MRSPVRSPAAPAAVPACHGRHRRRMPRRRNPGVTGECHDQRTSHGLMRRRPADIAARARHHWRAAIVTASARPGALLAQAGAEDLVSLVAGLVSRGARLRRVGGRALRVGLGPRRLGVDQLDRRPQPGDLAAQRLRRRPWWRSRRAPAATRRPRPAPVRNFSSLFPLLGSVSSIVPTAAAKPTRRGRQSPRRDHGRISIGMPIATRGQISSISRSVTAMHPFVQLNRQ